MSAKYFSFSILSLALILGVSENVTAQNASVDTTTEIRVLPLEINSRVRLDNGNSTSSNVLEQRQLEAETRVETRTTQVETRQAEMDARSQVRTLESEERNRRIEARRAEAEARRVEARAQGEAALELMLKRQVENTMRIIAATIDRLENIALRIESRISKLKEAGGDTFVAERYLLEARTQLTLAEEKLTTFSTIDLSVERVQDNFQRIRAVASEIKILLRSAHGNLVMAVRSLGAVQAEVSTGATVEVE
ncbi:MAG: hypothetical protein WDZ64_00705 [Parcubacteria group bacterium]